VEFDLHGLVGIRLIDASPADAARVAAQLGPLSAPLQREPDITLRFVNELQLTSPLRLLGLGDVGYTKDAFVVLRGKSKTPVRVQIPFESVGGRCEIICERGAPAVPFLIGIINLSVLARGGLPVHASAFRYRDTGVLVTGWSKGGKTELLLGALAHEASYVADEWVYFDAVRDLMFGIPEPVRVWDWQLKQLPAYRDRLGAAARLRLAALRHLAPLAAAASGNGHWRVAAWRRRLHALADLLERQRYVHLPPEVAFGATPDSLRERLDRVVLVGSHASPEITVERIAPEVLAARMALSLQEERADLVSCYRKFRFAFPEHSNPILDSACEVERTRLSRLLHDRECVALYHPYPPDIAGLFRAIQPFLHGTHL
jgi:hypothetical protein